MTTIRYSTFPRTQAPPPFLGDVIDLFKAHENEIGTRHLQKGLISDDVLALLRPGLVTLGFDVESGKQLKGRISRPVFFGENSRPELEYRIDAWHPDWKSGLEVEAGRALGGNAVYRDLVQALVMVDMEHLFLAVANEYHYGKGQKSKDYDKTVSIADALYSHERIRMPLCVCVIGY